MDFLKKIPIIQNSNPKRIPKMDLEYKTTKISKITSNTIVLPEYKDSYDMYRKLLVISMVYQGETISQASDYVHTTRKTRERWVKNNNEKD